MQNVSSSNLPGPTLADLAELVLKNGRKPSGEALSVARRKEIVRDLQRVAKDLCLPLNEIPADRALLRERFGDWNPASLGWTKLVTRRTRSSLSRALDHLPDMQPYNSDPKYLAPEWKEPLERFKVREAERKAKNVAACRYTSLVPFAMYCQQRNLRPDDVNESVVDAYVSARASMAVKTIAKKYLKRRVFAIWNTLAEEDPSWPHLEKDIQEQIVWPLDCFPESFQAEVKQYVTDLGVADAQDFDPAKTGYRRAAENAYRIKSLAIQHEFRGSGITPLAPTTAQEHSIVIRRAATMLVRHGGVPVESIRQIADAITPDAAELVLKDFDARHGSQAKKSTKSTQLSAYLRIAISWIRADDATLAEFRAMLSLCEPPREDIPASQLRVIDRFLDDMALTAKLVSLPEKTIEEIERRTGMRPPTVSEAVHVRSAIALMILLTLPVRGRTLALTELPFIDWPRHNGTQGRIRWPERTMKTKTQAVAPLDSEKFDLLRLYLRKYRAVLVKSEENPYLFPSPHENLKDRHIGTEPLTSGVLRLVYEQLGVRVTGHLWRKILASILHKLTNDERAVKALLGHSPNSRSTERYVQNLRALASARALDEIFSKVEREVFKKEQSDG